MSGRDLPCAYCGDRAIHNEHVIPKAMLRRRESEVSIHRLSALPAWVRETVPACGPCNWRKGQRRLIPPSWTHRLAELQQFFPGVEWRVWLGDVRDPAFAETHR